MGLRSQFAVCILLAVCTVVQCWNNPWSSIHSTNPEPILNYGAHEAITAKGKLYLFGGLQEDRSIFFSDVLSWIQFYADLRVFNLETKTWTYPTTTVTPPGRAWFCMESDNEGENLYVFGGLHKVGPKVKLLGDLWRYHIASNQWTDLSQNASTTFPTSRVGCAMSRIGGKIYMFGGLNYLQSPAINFNDIWTFDTHTLQWAQLPATNPPPGRALSELKKHRDSLYLFGGELFDPAAVSNPSLDPYHYIIDMWRFNPSTNAWNQVIPRNQLSHIRLHYASAIVGDNWLFHGGDYGNCTQLDLLVDGTSAYNFDENAWYENFLGKYAEGPEVKRSKFSVVGDTLYLTGGFGGIRCNNTEQTYNNGVYSFQVNNRALQLALEFDVNH